MNKENTDSPPGYRQTGKAPRLQTLWPGFRPRLWRDHDRMPRPPAMRWRWLNWPAPARRAATFTLFAGTTWLMLAPASTFEDVQLGLPFQDKVAHLAVFVLLAGASQWALPARWGRGWQRAAVFMALFAYGAAIECLQPLLPGAGRSFEWMDMALDAIGAGAGQWACVRSHTPP